MSEKKHKTDILGLVNFGIFLILVGIIVATTPGLVDRVADFFRDFNLTEVAPNMFLPVPGKDHPVVFNAVYWFCLLFGILQIPVLAARFIINDTVRRKADTVGGIIFWFGAAWAVTLIIAKSITWLNFAGYIIAFCGISILVQSIVVIVMRRD